MNIPVGQDFANCRTLLLRDRLVKEDFSEFAHDIDDNVYINVFNRMHAFHFVNGVVQLFRQEYVVSGERDRVNELGFNEKFIDKNLYSSGVALMTTKYLVDIEAYVYYLVLSAPLLVTPLNYFSYSTMFFNSSNNFMRYLIMILSQVPCFIVGYLANVNHPRVFGVTVAELLHIFDNNIHWNITNANVHNQPWIYTENLIPAVLAGNDGANLRNEVSRIFGLNSAVFLAKALFEKCHKNWSNRFTNGFMLVDAIGGAIEWVPGKDLYLEIPGFDPNYNAQDVHLRAFRGKVLPLIKSRIVHRTNNINPDNIQFAAEINYYNINAYFGNNIINPFGVYGAVEDEDMHLFCLLVTNFLPLYLSKYGANNIDSSFLFSVVKFVYGKDYEPDIAVFHSKITTVFNECVSRKLFRIMRVDEYTFLQSTSDYSFIYIIPMVKSEYSVKWYLKRDFAEFFKFFDGVYFKPKYLKMLNSAGLGVLKKLSRFDANVIESITTKTLGTSIVDNNAI